MVVPFSLGSFAVAVTAVLFSVFLLWQYVADRSARWRLWAAAMSLDAGAFALGAFLQINSETLALTVASERIRYTALIVLLGLVFLFTSAWRGVSARRPLHALLGVNSVLVLLVWASPWIVAPARRVLEFAWLAVPYVDGAPGPLALPVLAYLLATAVVLMAVWLRRARHGSRPALIFLLGFSAWTILGIHDLAAKFLWIDIIPYVAEYGFLGFSLAVLIIANRDFAVMRDNLASSEERFRAILHASPHAMVVLTPAGEVEYVNAAVADLLGCSEGDIRSNAGALIPPGELQRLRNRIGDAARRFEPLVFETTVAGCSGEHVELEGSGTWMGASPREIEGFVFVLTDTRGRKRAETEMRRLAYQDPLTGLPNRTAFGEQLDRLLESSRRQDDGDHWALLFLDLDDFKDINDRFGHAAGDTILTRTASRLRDAIRRTDHCYRLGGDEFLVVVTNVKDDVEVAKVAAKIVEYISRPQYIDKHEMRIGVSVGITVYPHDGADRERLLANADIAMYAAKADGANYRFFTEEMNIAAIRRMDIEHSLPPAIVHGSLELHYQPILGPDGELVGSESLARWNHPVYGWISPGEFIPIAERTGAIRELGYWVMEEAMSQLRRWMESGGPWTRVGINLSPRQFEDDSLVDSVQEVLDRLQLDRSSIVFEITESSVMRNPAAAVAQIERLRATGVRFALDDFGSGYSAFSYLNRLPVDIIKIDPSFVARAGASEGDERTLRTLVDLAHDLGMVVVVEGVETAEQVSLARSMGPVRMQGYYFARPMPGERILGWAREAGCIEA
ncbi:MAG: EAL domain-containing protein [Spirochaetes bacterium]|jgi:diguanylate cyclase (GGDEF)-like protein/PAS domain S-box-containing protein|nr:EAL domain-containing protein [Spirochaetota bacterium]